MMLWVEKQVSVSQYFTEKQHIANTVKQHKEIYPVKHKKKNQGRRNVSSLWLQSYTFIGITKTWGTAWQLECYKGWIQAALQKRQGRGVPSICWSSSEVQKSSSIAQTRDPLRASKSVCYRQPSTCEERSKAFFKVTLSSLCITEPDSYRALYHHHLNICWKSITMGYKQSRFLEGVMDTGWATQLGLLFTNNEELVRDMESEEKWQK